MGRLGFYRRCASVLTYALLLPVLLGATPARALQLMTEELPPYSFLEGNQPKGLSIDIIKLLFKRAGIQFEIRIVPLKRALATVANSSDACVFPLERTQAREVLYTWISPLLITRTGFYTKSDSRLVIRSLKDAQNLSVGIYAGSALHEYLSTFDFTGLQVAREELLNARKLQANRIDLWATDSVSGRFFARRAGIADIREQYLFLTTLRGIACNREMSPGIVQPLQRELKRMHADGAMRGIMDRYRYQE